VAGGLIIEWDPDTRDLEERRALREKVPRAVRRRTFELLWQFLRNPDNPGLEIERTFPGSHMISRSLETAIVGGLRDVEAYEDTYFGLDLADLAGKRGQRVVGAKDRFLLVTSLRESDRTPASPGRLFGEIDPEAGDRVPDILAGEDFSVFRARVIGLFRKAYEEKDERRLRELMTLADGTLIVGETALGALVAFMRNHSFLESGVYLERFQADNFGSRDPVRILYEWSCPRVGLSDDYLQRVKESVRARRGGKEFVERLETSAGRIRFKDQGS
jgi:hypothetical protein